MFSTYCRGSIYLHNPDSPSAVSNEPHVSYVKMSIPQLCVQNKACLSVSFMVDTFTISGHKCRSQLGRCWC